MTLQKYGAEKRKACQQNRLNPNNPYLLCFSLVIWDYPIKDMKSFQTFHGKFRCGWPYALHTKGYQVFYCSRLCLRQVNLDLSWRPWQPCKVYCAGQEQGVSANGSVKLTLNILHFHFCHVPLSNSVPLVLGLYCVRLKILKYCACQRRASCV